MRLGVAAAPGRINFRQHNLRKFSMKYRFASIALLAVLGSVPAQAASQLAVGFGANLNNSQTAVAAATQGLAAAGSLATANGTSIGTGIAVNTPAGSTSAGVGAAVGNSAAVSGAASLGNGAAISAGQARNVGAGVGIGFTNVTP
jgi:hypothetical protein